jgi:alginate O-acetyltransferase complex protein AlgI
VEIISLQFAIFVLIAVSVYHLLPFKFKHYWLLFSSFFFYFLFDPRFLLVLVILSLINWGLAKRQIINGRSSRFSSAALLLNISSFGFLKIFSSRYAGLVIGMSNPFSSTWLLPVGFSFYILQLISIHLEIRSGKMTEIPSITDFMLYLVYFPKLISGPIEKPKSFFERLANPKVVDNRLFSLGIGLILLGIMRKLFIANLLSKYLPDWTGDISVVGWPQIIGYVLMVYNDFAGYTAIVRGTSCLFGIELSPNFLQPFFSRNFSEFWNRWHISLSTWLREVIYFPLSRKLSRNSGRKIAVICAYTIPPILTMFASGFWHGASLAMLLWGGIHGFFLIIERLLYEKYPRLRPQSLPAVGRFISGMVVFLLFCLSMVPFAVNSIKPTIGIWSNLFSIAGFSSAQLIVPIVLLGAFSFLFDFFSQISGKDLWWETLPVIPRSAVIAAILLFIGVAILINTYSSGPVFIYQKF